MRLAGIMAGDAKAAIESALFVITFYIALPSVVIWGWIRWAKHSWPRGVLPLLSVTGFALATASALLAASAIVYAQVFVGFAYHDPRLMRVFGWGFLISASGSVCAMAGIWRRSPLRWHAFCCSLGTLAFWVAMAGAE
jgi:hypothetical protein